MITIRTNVLTLGHKPSLKTRLIIILVFSAFISACLWDQECESMFFDELNNIAYILLIEGFDWGERKINDPEIIAVVLNSLKNIPGCWTDPWYAAPLGGYGAIFYSADGNRINEYRITQKRAELVDCGNEHYIRISN